MWHFRFLKLLLRFIPLHVDTQRGVQESGQQNHRGLHGLRVFEFEPVFFAIAQLEIPAAGLFAAHGKEGWWFHHRLGDFRNEDLEIGFILAQQKFQVLPFSTLEQGFRLFLRAFFHRRPD